MRIDSWLKIGKDDGYSFDLLKSRLEVPNPEYLSRQRMGFNTNGVARFDPLYREVGNELWIPRALVHKYGNNNVEDNTVLGSSVDFKSKIVLGPTETRTENQKSFVDSLEDALRRKGGAIGQAAPGFGKTVCALEVIARLGRTTAVLVHKSFLMNQWIERIHDCFDISDDDIGFVQQDRCEYEGKKIVMIMVQSLLAREYPKSLYEYFGTVVVDEVHRFGAVEFRKAITKFPAKYRLGVTATPDRSDGLEEVFFSHIGDIAAIGDTSKRRMKATVHLVDSKVQPTDLQLRMMQDFRKKLNLTKVTSYLIEHEGRTRRICRLILNALKAGRKVMVLSSRREHLNSIYERMKLDMAKANVRFTIGYYVGGMSERDLTISATRHLILATFQMAAEGLDIPDLDTLFLVTPKGDIEQAVGRILREHPDKKNPMVVDITDNAIPLCVGLTRKRLRQYHKTGAVVK